MKSISFSTPQEETLYKLLFSTTKRFFRRYLISHEEDTISCITLSIYEILQSYPSPDFTSKPFLTFCSSVLQRNLRLYVQKQMDPPQTQLQRQISYRSSRNEPFFKTIHLLECGHSPAEIEARLGYFSKRASKSPNPKQRQYVLSPFQISEIQSLLSSGTSIRKICKLYNLTPSKARLLARSSATPIAS